MLENGSMRFGAPAGYPAIAEDVKLGPGVQISNFVSLRDCAIGENTRIGTFVEIEKNVAVGRNCRISSHTFICEGVTIEDDVFIGHGVNFINNKYPRALGGPGPAERTVVKKGASIGSGATILGNIVVGENAIIGAGSTVTKEVPDNCIVAGNPARIIRSVINE